MFALVAGTVHRTVPLLWVRVRFQQRINPIVNVSFTMGFIGAGDRTRTGTLSPAVDFESTTSTIPSHRQVCFKFCNHQPPLAILIVAAFGGLMSPAFAVPGECPRRKRLRPSPTAALATPSLAPPLAALGLASV